MNERFWRLCFWKLEFTTQVKVVAKNFVEPKKDKHHRRWLWDYDVSDSKVSSFWKAMFLLRIWMNYEKTSIISDSYSRLEYLDLSGDLFLALRELSLLSSNRYSSSSSSCPIGLAPVGANHLRDQILPYSSVLCKMEQLLSTALTPFCYVIQPLSAWTSSSGFPVHFRKDYVFDQSVIVHSADVTK